MSLSVCLLTRNEEKNLERVLGSVAAIAHEKIVVDTGSTDRTLSVAEALGAKVSQIVWQNDFSAGRNFALEQATGDWILWLNPDEELLSASRDKLPGYLADENALAYTLRVHDLEKAEPPHNVSETFQTRLFRRSAGVRFQGRLHPSFQTPIEALARNQGKKVLPAELIIRRHTYLSVLTPEKLRWAADLLQLELRDRPGQIHYLIEYGRTLLRLNDPQGHAILAEAVEQLEAYRGAPAPPGPTVGSLLEYLLTVSPEQSRSKMSREEARDLAMRWFPRTPPVVWALARHFASTGDHARAAMLLEELLRMGRTAEYDHSVGFEPEIIGALALMNLGTCYAKLGELEKAQHCFGQMLSHPAHQVQARQNFAMVERMRGRIAPG